MYSILALLAATQAAEAEFPPFVTLTITQARRGTSETIHISSTEMAGVKNHYWFARERRVRDGSVVGTDQAFSRDCPGVRTRLAELTRLRMPQPAVPGLRKEGTIRMVADGVDYLMEGRADDSDSSWSNFSIRSNVDSPLAAWAERLKKTLSPCWRTMSGKPDFIRL